MEFKCVKCRALYTTNGDIPEFKCVCSGTKFKKTSE